MKEELLPDTTNKGLGANMWSLEESLLHILLPSFSFVALLLPFMAQPLNNPGRKQKVKEATWKFLNASNIPESFLFLHDALLLGFFHLPLPIALNGQNLFPLTGVAVTVQCQAIGVK